MWVMMKWSTYASYQLAAFGLGGLAAAAMIYLAERWTNDYNEAKAAGVVR